MRRQLPWLKGVFAFFEATPQKVYSYRELGFLLDQNRLIWHQFPRTITLRRFVSTLQDEGRLRRIDLEKAWEPGEVASGRAKTRYTWGEVSPYSIGVSLRGGSYISHGSAVFLLGLTDQIPKTIYVNKEQGPKSLPEQSLAQDAIARAFAHQQRRSNYAFEAEGYRYLLLSGKHSNDLEVSEKELDSQPIEVVRVTKLERTLIDIAVRPEYAGGAFQVLKAYRHARQQGVSIGTLLATLKRLEYVYPYHQAIGFYLEQAGFPAAKLEPLRAQGLNYDFYLTHGMKETRYVPEWRLWVPSGIESLGTDDGR